MRTTMRRQRGATLLVGLIMLVLMTLAAVSAFNLGKGNLQIVANMQYRNDSLHAANDAIQEVISKNDFTVFPPIPLLTSGSNTKGYDITGDGTADVSVTIGSTSDAAKPTCIKAQVIQNGNLNPFQADAGKARADAGCMANIQQTYGLTGVAVICAKIVGDMATAVEPQLSGLVQQATDLGCGAAVTASPGSSLCAESLWDIRATAHDAVTQARVATNVGVTVRVASANIAVACP